MAKLNVPILLMAIVLSTFLWFVQYGQNLETAGTVPVKLRLSNEIGLPVARLSVTDIAGFKLQLNGAAELVERAETDPDITNFITIDLSTAHPGSALYPVQYGGYLTKIAQAPRNVSVTIEEIVTKPVPVVVDLKGKLSDPNSNLESYPTSENSAMITAPKSIADRITAARATLQVNQIDPSNPRPQDSILVAVDEKRQTYEASIEPERVTITPIVIAAHISVNAVVSPVIMGVPAPGFLPVGAKLTPSKVQVSGPTSTLVNMGSVRTEPIDVTGLTATKGFDVKLALPSGTTSSTKKIHVRYEVQEDPARKRVKTTDAATATTTPSVGSQPGPLP